MSYYFIENKYPIQDPNIDLNFNNDILYSDLTGDSLDKYNNPDVVNPYVLPSKSQTKSSLKKPPVKKEYNIYLIFVMVVIFLLLLWYFYRGTDNKTKNIIDMYPDQPELTMLSPDIGAAARYGKV
jgi:hypothetical protein